MAVEPPVPCTPKALFAYFSTSAGAAAVVVAGGVLSWPPEQPTIAAIMARKTSFAISGFFIRDSVGAGKPGRSLSAC